MLTLAGIAKRFGATEALTDASLTVRPGTIHALLGENGAGKTTLMRIAFGLVQPDRGTIHGRDGRPLVLPSPAAAISAGIGMVHQHFTIVDAMTVAENVALGGRGSFDRRATAARIADIARTLGLTIDPDARAGTLSVPARQQLEIIKALSREAELLILDEPTAVLAPAEAEALLRQLRALAAGGLAIVLITHKLREALAVTDDVTVLRRGTTVLSGPVHALAERELAAAMVGPGSVTEKSAASPAPTAIGTEATPRGPWVVRARGISVVDAQGVLRVRGVDLDIHAGDIIGIAGVEGSGARELLRAIARRVAPVSGSIDGPAVVGFVPEDRHREAVALDFTVTENVALRGAGHRRGLVRWNALRDHARALVERFDVRGPGVDAPMRALSGGNQQKLVLAREMEASPPLLVVENPTRGLDLRATAAVHERLRAARDVGMAIVMYSSDLDELLLLADRVFAMFGGALIPTTRERHAMGQAMLGTSIVAPKLETDRSA